MARSRTASKVVTGRAVKAFEAATGDKVVTAFYTPSGGVMVLSSKILKDEGEVERWFAENEA